MATAELLCLASHGLASHGLGKDGAVGNPVPFVYNLNAKLLMMPKRKKVSDSLRWQ